MCVFGAFLLTGCDVDVDTVGDEVVGEAADELGEAACATVTADDAISDNYCGAESSISADGSYDHGTDCPTQYVVEFTGQVQNISSWGDGWGDTLPSTQGLCEAAKYSMGIYYYNSGTWTIDDTLTVTGTWSGGACSFDAPTDLPTETATKWRLAVKAWQCPTSGLCFFPTTKKAKAYAYGSSCSP